jgi:hypothetical protein
MNVATLGPKTGLQNHRKAGRYEEYSARSRYRSSDDTNDDQQDAEHEYGPFDHRVIDKTTPLVLRDHRGDVGPKDSSRKDLRGEREPR